jgi:catechol 2,3-dioxygenase-like lactoylglutathione lyase family enzyme
LTVTTTLGVVRCSLGVSELDAAVDFYSGVWGLEIVSKSADLVYLTARGSPSPWELRLRASDSDRLDLLTYATADDRALRDIVALVAGDRRTGARHRTRRRFGRADRRS